MESVQLPITNETGCYEIRLESIGGLGANLCGKMLGELGIKYLGLNSASFSSYGSEKTGTPVKAYIRYCEQNKEIRVHSPVTHPHLLGIFHDALMADASIFNGCSENTVMVINTTFSKEEIIEKYIRKNEDRKNEFQKGALRDTIPAGRVYCVPAQKIAMETHSRINVVMLGAMAKAMGFVPLEAINRICEDALGKKYPDALSGNLEGIRRGYTEVQCVYETVNNPAASNEISNFQCSRLQGDDSSGIGKMESDNDKINSPKEEPEWGYMTAPMGGINTKFGNSVISDLSPSRQGYIPIFIQDRCINCGLCDSTCPDMVFQFEKGVYKDREMMVNKGLDYYHCKGCLRCVEVCPTKALVKGLEAEHPSKEWFAPNKDLLRNPEYYEKAGSDGYITSESYLTEKRVEGGEV